MLIYGRELTSVNIIPQIQHDLDYDWSNHEKIRDKWEKSQISNERLIEIYNSVFTATLISQAVYKKDRYRPVHNKSLEVGDILLLVEPNTKRSNYPVTFSTSRQY